MTSGSGETLHIRPETMDLANLVPLPTRGGSTISNMARRFGITSEINTHPSMVLGTSDVRVIDLTAAFAAVSAGGKAVQPYAITKVTTAEGRALYERTAQPQTVLVDAWVAAGITDLLQTAVNTGTGRAAQIGRPVAGKTGTTSSNKDGWFLGFSSGITTGVWMGRDDARRVAGLQGGTAPARAFADFMRVAVADRPVEEFTTEVELPQWQLESDEEAYYGDPALESQFVDENGQPIELEPDYVGQAPVEDPGDAPAPDPADKPRLDRRWIDEQTGDSADSGPRTSGQRGSNPRDQ